jgi:hypothetical protein
VRGFINIHQAQPHHSVEEEKAMRTLINLLVFVSILGLAGCFPMFGTGGQASVQYTGPNGDTANFTLTSFDTRFASVVQVGENISITITPEDGSRILDLRLSGPLASGFSCPLTGGVCTLGYSQQSTAFPLQATVKEGTLTVTSYDAQTIAYTFEATLQTSSGGSFSVRGTGSSRIER